MNEDPSRKYMPMITEKETKYRQAMERIRDYPDIPGTSYLMRQIAREALEEEVVVVKAEHIAICPTCQFTLLAWPDMGLRVCGNCGARLKVEF